MIRLYIHPDIRNPACCVSERDESLHQWLFLFSFCKTKDRKWTLRKCKRWTNELKIITDVWSKNTAGWLSLVRVDLYSTSCSSRFCCQCVLTFPAVRTRCWRSADASVWSESGQQTSRHDWSAAAASRWPDAELSHPSSQCWWTKSWSLFSVTRFVFQMITFDHCSSNIPVEFLCQCPQFVLQTYLLKATDLHTWQVIAESNSLRLSCPCPNLPHIDYSHTVSVLWIGTVSCWVTFSISPPSPLCRRPLSSPVHLSVAAASRWASDPALRTATQRKGHRDTKSDEKGDAASLLNGSCDIHTAEVLLKEAAVASSAYDSIQKTELLYWRGATVNWATRRWPQHKTSRQHTQTLNIHAVWISELLTARQHNLSPVFTHL